MALTLFLPLPFYLLNGRTNMLFSLSKQCLRELKCFACRSHSGDVAETKEELEEKVLPASRRRPQEAILTFVRSWHSALPPHSGPSLQKSVPHYYSDLFSDSSFSQNLLSKRPALDAHLETSSVLFHLCLYALLVPRRFFTPLLHVKIPAHCAFIKFSLTLPDKFHVISPLADKFHVISPLADKFHVISPLADKFHVISPLADKFHVISPLADKFHVISPLADKFHVISPLADKFHVISPLADKFHVISPLADKFHVISPLADKFHVISPLADKFHVISPLADKFHVISPLADKFHVISPLADKFHVISPLADKFHVISPLADKFHVISPLAEHAVLGRTSHQAFLAKLHVYEFASPLLLHWIISPFMVQTIILMSIAVPDSLEGVTHAHAYTHMNVFSICI
uniref:Uncharacterized protein n=1 Tax=Equus asinus asinus TaxID=83772 RepID=A0A8C4LQA5_EQUAS